MTFNASVSDSVSFFEGLDPLRLAADYGTPLYVYNERILREKCRELTSLFERPRFQTHYAMKANSSLALLAVIREEGLHIDAVSPGEIFLAGEAGFSGDEIFFVCNNASDEEMKFALEKGVLVSVDSLSQLERYGRLNPGGRVAARFNPGVGAGHHQKVVTGGSETKFGISGGDAPRVKEALLRYRLRLAGINQHIGSLFMNGDPYLEGVKSLLEIAGQFPGLEFVDLGGGFGTPYHKQDGESRLDIAGLREGLSPLLDGFEKAYGRGVTWRIEPGRYVSAECGALLGRVNAVKRNGSKKFAGTDIGMNVLARPVLYGSHHDIEVYGRDGAPRGSEAITVTGNICESGDIIASDRLLPEIREGDVLGVLDAGAYGYAMASVYNSRPMPAEVMIKRDKSVALIRKRETFERLLLNQVL